MSYQDRHDVLYQECFQNFAKGHALYKDVSTARLRPGVCGYFDHNGDWQVIADLAKVDDELKKEGWTESGNIDVIPDGNDSIWGHKTSDNVTSFPIGVHAQAGIPNTPVMIGFGIKHDSRKTKGAVLATDGQVSHDQIQPLSSTKAKNWFIINAEAILKKYESTRKRGIWVITKTYHVKRRGVALLRSKETEISFKVDMELDKIGTIGPEASWWNSQKEQEWEIHHNEAGIVVFMSGWFWRPKWYRREVKPTEDPSKQKRLLGDGDGSGKMDFSFPSDDSHVDVVEITSEKIGEFNEE